MMCLCLCLCVAKCMRNATKKMERMRREKRSLVYLLVQCVYNGCCCSVRKSHNFMRVSFGVSCYCVYFVAFDFGQHFSVSNVLNMQVTVVTSEPERNISSSATAIRD